MSWNGRGGARAALLCIVFQALIQLHSAQQQQQQQQQPRGSSPNVVSEEINWEVRRSKGSKELRLGSELRGEIVKYGEDTARYTLAGLLPSKSYEVKLSYPGISHAKVSLRKLLDVEKLEFRTDDAGLVILGWGGHRNAPGSGGGKASVAGPVVLVSARHRAPHVQGKEAHGAYLIFDLALSEVRFGLPAEAAALAPILGVILVFVVVTACWIAPVGGLDGHPAARWQRSRQQAQPQGTKRN